MRTEVTQPIISTYNGKWSAVLSTFRGDPGSEYMVSSVESAPVFDTEEEAYAGGNRALGVLEETGKFPNMCEAF
jgi:hypothetical protein